MLENSRALVKVKKQPQIVKKSNIHFLLWKKAALNVSAAGDSANN